MDLFGDDLFKFSLVFLCWGYKDTVFTIVPVGLELCQVPSLWTLTFFSGVFSGNCSGFNFQEVSQKLPFILYVINVCQSC